MTLYLIKRIYQCDKCWEKIGNSVSAGLPTSHYCTGKKQEKEHDK